MGVVTAGEYSCVFWRFFLRLFLCVILCSCDSLCGCSCVFLRLILCVHFRGFVIFLDVHATNLLFSRRKKMNKKYACVCARKRVCVNWCLCQCVCVSV